MKKLTALFVLLLISAAIISAAVIHNEAAAETVNVSVGSCLTLSGEGLSDEDYVCETINDDYSKLTIKSNKEITLSSDGNTVEDYIIVVDSPNGANLTFSDLRVNTGSRESQASFDIVNGNVTITLVGKNVLISGQNHAGLQKSNVNCTLIIQGSGELTANGGDKSAGIGGGKNGNGTNITIKSGTINAKGGTAGAGIGGGEGGSGTNITISGGTVTADNLSDGGAGIGGGKNGSGSSITISDGTVNATGGSSSDGGGAGIGGGGGSGSDGTTITISGGSVIANGGSGSSDGGGAGIGGGGKGSGSDIEISGGSVTATGGGSNDSTYANGGGAGIGGGNKGSNNSVTIRGGSVTATGGIASAGIGGGYNSSDTNIIISNGTVTATSYNSAGIGGGYNSSGTDIKISGGSVTATGNTGIGGGDSNVKITGISEDSYPWVFTNSISRTNTDDYWGIIFDGVGGDIGGPDGIVYGHNKTVILTAPYTLGSPRSKLTVQGGVGEEKKGATFVTNNNLTLDDGVILYIEKGATLNKHDNMTIIDGEIQHEDASPYVMNSSNVSICNICGKEEPHTWEDDWQKNETHHWYKCVGGKDCSVDKNTIECSISIEDLSKVADSKYGEHDYDFDSPTVKDGKLYYYCKVCNYEYSVDIPIISLIKEGEENKPLTGAEFGLYSDAGCEALIAAATTAINGENKAVVSFNAEQLNKTYYISETAPPKGYERSTEVFTAKVGADGTVTYGTNGNTCVNTKIKPGTIQIKKVDETGNSLPSAEFGLYLTPDPNDKADPVATGTTGADGYATFTAVQGKEIELDKIYYIKEITPPKGYKPSTEVFTATVGENGEVTYGTNGNTCENKKIDPIQIKKIDSETKEPLPNADFGLYLASGGSPVATGTTGADGYATFSTERVECGKNYIIKEIDPPDGYDRSYEEFTVSVSENGTLIYDGDDIPICENTKTKIVPGEIRIRNIDGRTDENLSGAVFTLFVDNNGELASTSITADGINGVAVFNPADTESIALFAAADGQEIKADMDYVIMQTAPPNGGYTQISEDKFYVNIDADGIVTYTDARGTTAVPVFKNYKSDKIMIYKYAAGETQTVLPGADFELYTIGEDSSKTVVENKTSGADGKVLFDFVGELGGTYYIKETKAPDGYKLNENPITVVVKADGTVTYNGISAPFGFVNEKDDTEPPDKPTPPTPIDPPIPVIPDPVTPDPIQLYKTDGEGNPLAGALFYLCDSDDRVIATGTTAINSENKAIVSFTAADGVELDTTYYIKEIRAPEGYTVSKEIFKATVGADGKVKYGALGSDTIPVCRNEKIPVPADPPAPVDPNPPVNPYPPVYPYPPVIITPIVTDPTPIDPDPIDDEPYEDVSSAAGIFDDDTTNDNGKGLAAVITLLALTSVGLIVVRKKTSK